MATMQGPSINVQVCQEIACTVKVEAVGQAVCLAVRNDNLPHRRTKLYLSRNEARTLRAQLDQAIEAAEMERAI